MAEKKYFGFGFNPEQSMNHILVVIPSNKELPVMFYERSRWSKKDIQTIIAKKDKPKASLPFHKWEKIAGSLMNEFNRRLKKDKISTGSWDGNYIPVEKLLGKEMLVLVWAIEDSDPALITTAVRNWHGFSPEERWWLFTMTNASSGGINDRRGWRKALRYALTENPVDETKDIVRFEIPESSKKQKKKKTDDSSSGQAELF